MDKLHRVVNVNGKEHYDVIEATEMTEVDILKAIAPVEIPKLRKENKRLRDALEDVYEDVFLNENNRRHVLIKQALEGEGG